MDSHEKTAQEELYSMILKGLIPEELGASKVLDELDESTWSIFVELRDGENYYQLIHKCDYLGIEVNKLVEEGKFKRPKDIIIGEEYNELERIANIVAKETNGSVGHPNSVYSIDGKSDEGKTITSHTAIEGMPYIEFRGKLTLREVADFCERYQRHFKEVRISEAYFYNMSKHAYENSGLPQWKITESWSTNKVIIDRFGKTESSNV